MAKARERVVRILGVGDAPPDGVLRKSVGRDFQIFMGSEAVHEEMQAFCLKLEDRLHALGLELSDLSPEELKELLIGLGAVEDAECES